MRQRDDYLLFIVLENDRAEGREEERNRDIIKHSIKRNASEFCPSLFVIQS